MNKPEISVLMPVFNTKEEYLRESIESILDQSFENFELIILDDGSKNNAKEVIKSYVEKDKRVKFFENEENKGVSYSRNKLIELANGKYIAWQDSDDISVENRLKYQHDYMERNPDITVLGSNIFLYPNPTIYYYPEKIEIYDLIKGCSVANGSIMVRLSDIEGIKYKEHLQIGEDYDFWCQVAAKGLKIRTYKKPLMTYRQLKTGLTLSNKKYSAKNNFEIKMRLLDTISTDKDKKLKIYDAIVPTEQNKVKPLEYIFSIKKGAIRENEVKIIRIFGLKIQLKRTIK